MAYQLQLKVLWFNKLLGLGIDQIGLKQRYCITQYYFWPKTKVWEQLRYELESKTWLNQQERLKILTLATEIINAWPKIKNEEDLKHLQSRFSEVLFINLKD